MNLDFVPPEVRAGVSDAIDRAVRSGKPVHLTQVEHDVLVDACRFQPHAAGFTGPLLILGKPVVIVDAEGAPATADPAVWVVTSDYGLNGFEVHGVYATEPTAEDVAAHRGRAQSVTGYGGTEVEQQPITASARPAEVAP